MDEMDMAADSGSQQVTQQTTQQASQQSGTGQAVDAAVAPSVPVQRDAATVVPEVPAEHFETPTWLGPGRASPPVAPAPAPQIPAQPHAYAPPAPEREFKDYERWVERSEPRLLAGSVLVLAVLGVVGSLVASILTQSIYAIVALIGCCFVAVIFRGALMSTGVTVVELKGARLEIHRDGTREVFNLADPVGQIEIFGTPGDPAWRARLYAVDGRPFDLTPAQVNPAELHPALIYFRAHAEQARLERERRFNR